VLGEAFSLLHDDYSPEEKWREFFKSLGVKEGVGTDVVRKFAEWVRRREA
jgi:hypothetical protein